MATPSLGGLEVEIKDGIARLKSNGALAGSTLRYNRGLKRIHEITGEPLSAIVATTSWNQATSLGLPKHRENRIRLSRRPSHSRRGL